MLIQEAFELADALCIPIAASQKKNMLLNIFQFWQVALLAYDIIPSPYLS